MAAATMSGTFNTAWRSPLLVGPPVSSVMSVAIATTWTTCRTSAAISGVTRGLIPGRGARATRALLPKVPAAMATLVTRPPRDRPRSMLTWGSTAWAVSTYQESNGPLSSARYTPCKANTSANNGRESATVASAMAAAWKATATSSTRRRPIASASPPVGSSRTSTTSPWAAKARPTCPSERPRSSGRRTTTGMSSPVCSHLSPSSVRNRRRAVTASERGPVIPWVRGRGTCRAGPSLAGHRRPL